MTLPAPPVPRPAPKPEAILPFFYAAPGQPARLLARPLSHGDWWQSFLDACKRDGSLFERTWPIKDSIAYVEAQAREREADKEARRTVKGKSGKATATSTPKVTTAKVSTAKRSLIEEFKARMAEANRAKAG